MKSELIEDVYELSPMQTGMLYHALQERSDIYTVQINYVLETAFDVDVARKCLERLMERHTALRTVFNWTQLAEPVQIVLKNQMLRFSFIDLRTMSADQQPDEVEQIRQRDREVGFDLRKDALMRLIVVQLGDEYFELVWSYHHIILDGWACSVLIREFWVMYREFIEKKTSTLQTPVPYVRYILWLRSQNLKKSLGYWMNCLHGYEQPVRLAPIDRAPGLPMIQCVKCAVDGNTGMKLGRLIREHAITLSTFFQCVWGLQIAFRTGATDVVFGAVVSGRPPELNGVQHIAGLFINTIPVRTHFGRATTVGALLKEMQSMALSSYPHMFLQLGDIIAALGCQKTGLFDTILIFENFPSEDEIPMRDTRVIDEKNKIRRIDTRQRINYPLNITVLPGESIEVAFIFDDAVFSRPYIETLKTEFLVLMSTLLSNTDQHVTTALQTLQGSERRVALNQMKTMATSVISENF